MTAGYDGVDINSVREKEKQSSREEATVEDEFSEHQKSMGVERRLLLDYRAKARIKSCFCRRRYDLLRTVSSCRNLELGKGGPKQGGTSIFQNRTLASDNLMVTPGPHMTLTKLCVFYDPHSLGPPFQSLE